MTNLIFIFYSITFKYFRYQSDVNIAPFFVGSLGITPKKNGLFYWYLILS